MSSSNLSTGLGTFAMLPLPQDLVSSALRERRINPADVAVLWLLINALDWRTGRAWITSAELAAAHGHTQREAVMRSLTRLRREGLVARGTDKRERNRVFWCVNPEVAVTGGKQRRSLQWTQFTEAIS